jgi:2-polyprenyl-6-methoxyphenol hydroxylase-like FAD-dependent oxidoreductase
LNTAQLNSVQFRNIVRREHRDAKHTSPRIAIVGGGPGGLTLARIVQTRGIGATIFEQEHPPNERPQGGSLDLHPQAGQYAVSLAGLTEQFRALARYEDQGTRLLDKTGAVLFEEGEDDRPEIDRTELRAIRIGIQACLG